MASFLWTCALLFITLALAPSHASCATLDFTQQGAPFRRGFNGCVGSGHALLGLRSDWRKHLAAARSDLGVQYIRFHGILDDDMSVVRDDGSGYSFFNTDSVLDYVLSLGMLPVVELSFMPRSLAARANETIFHYNGITSPPSDWQKFSDLIVAFVSHHVARYGLASVQTWYYEVWNEPNCGFWTGTKEEYFQLYRVTALAVKSVHDSLRVGGPATCMVDWIPEFVEFAKTSSLPLDFVSSHLYPTDPVVPQGLPLLLTEYNAGLCYGGTNLSGLDGAYAAAFVTRQVPYLNSIDNLVFYSYWTFTDIFEEGGQLSEPWSNSFGMQTIHQVAKPVYRALQLLNKLARGRIYLSDTQPQADNVDVWATLDDAAQSDAKHAVFVTNFNTSCDATPLPARSLNLTLRTSSTCAPSAATVYSIDDVNGPNPRSAWTGMGSPMYPTADEISQMILASELQLQQLPLAPVAPGEYQITLQLQPQSVTVLAFSCEQVRV